MNSTPVRSARLDLKRELKPLYAAKSGAITAVAPGPLRYLCSSGQGDPNTSPAYARAVEALFAVSYCLKFETRRRTGVDYGVMPLEGLWWSDDRDAFTRGDRSRWRWTMMILQPGFVTGDDVTQAIAETARKRRFDPGLVQLEEITEGPSAQTLHVGPFSTEGSTIAAMHEWIAVHGHRLRGKHHEIYLSDIRRAEPARWKTIIRQPYD